MWVSWLKKEIVNRKTAHIKSVSAATATAVSAHSISCLARVTKNR